jgi:hypothetical protein
MGRSMELLEGERLRRHILEDYSKNPKGWSFTISPSESGFYDAVVSGPEGAWMLKIDSLFKPLPIMLGSPIETRPDLKSTIPFSYGYRKLSPDIALQLLGGESYQHRDETIASILSVLRSETVVPEPGRSYAQGPIVFTNPRKVDLSESQRVLDDRLTSEMRRLLRARYPAYG